MAQFSFFAFSLPLLFFYSSDFLAVDVAFSFDIEPAPDIAFFGGFSDADCLDIFGCFINLAAVSCSISNFLGVS